MLSERLASSSLAMRLEYLVAGTVAELLVGLGEAVDIDHGHAQSGMIGYAGPPEVQVGFDAGPVEAAGERVAAIGISGRPAFLLGHLGLCLFQGIAEQIVGIQQTVGASHDLPAAAGQVGFIVEIGDLLAGGLDLDVLHLSGDDKLVVDALPLTFIPCEVGQPVLRRFARLDIVAGRGLDVGQHRFDRAQIGQRGTLT